MRRLAIAIIVVVTVLSLHSCSPEFWQGVSRGMEAISTVRPNPPAKPRIKRKSKVVCVKYKKTYGWSKGYEVEADIIKGSELNRATKTFDYNSYSTYVVVWWDKGECSILKLDYYYGSISAWGVNATDQNDRKWEVSTSGFCY